MKIPRRVVILAVNQDGSKLVRTGRVVGASKRCIYENGKARRSEWFQGGLFVELDCGDGKTFVADANYQKSWWFDLTT